MVKYIVRPGHIISRNDGDEHYISANRLIHLHEVQASECIIIRNKRDQYKLKGIGRDLINLFPRSDGNYKLYNKSLLTGGKNDNKRNSQQF